MKKIIIVLCSAMLSGCVALLFAPVVMKANGDHFEEVEPPPINMGAVYIFRKLKLAASIYCQPFSVNGERVPCLRNGGYIRLELQPGEHVIGFPKRALEFGKGFEQKIQVIGGKTSFYEWGTDLDDINSAGSYTSMTFVEFLIEHAPESAVTILKDLRKS
ncbi:hypothetical protein P3339_17290 [Microbulbifer sp. MLAF003]|uniref:hypothetical protein n=1 Tax=Microbulbifer sp. MLAF003 TaxID=3032582 RepID=UPI0024AD2B4E|nr:hypothetical protein [Microbulbifer sp. MLAF003]WHI50186.1 hypothetical protein P3339_17290 [Microbulbifer sp. MLAF003]